MRRLFASVALVLAFAPVARANSPATPSNFSRRSPSGAFEARAIAGAFNHTRIEVYGPMPGVLFWANTLGASGEWVVNMTVTDQGCVLAEFDRGTFMLFTSAGKTGLVYPLYNLLSSGERGQFGAGGLHGELDTIHSHLKRAIWTEGAQSWVYVRTYWGHILPFNCATGNLDPSQALADRIEASLVAETKTWLATAPASFVGTCPSCRGPCLDPVIVDRLFIIRTHQLADGERVINAALAARLPDHDKSLEDDLNRVYDPASLASKARRIDFRYPLIGLILFLAGTVWFMWKRAGRN